MGEEQNLIKLENALGNLGETTNPITPNPYPHKNFSFFPHIKTICILSGYKKFEKNRKFLLSDSKHRPSELCEPSHRIVLLAKIYTFINCFCTPGRMGIFILYIKKLQIFQKFQMRARPAVR